MKFSIEKRLKTAATGAAGAAKSRGRAGTITTPHGIIQTPAFIVVGTKATVKALTPEQVAGLGAQAVLANTYHLYLQPGEELLKKSGGLHKFMNWPSPTFTDSGGFQVFSLGAAFGNGASKIANRGDMATDVTKDVSKNLVIDDVKNETASSHEKLARIDEDGVTFRSVIDGSEHRFTPERSIEIQHNIGADIIFAFDECTSPHAPREYQIEAMNRTHRWAERCLDFHKKNVKKIASGMSDDEQVSAQALFGIVQGGRFEDLRKESATVIGAMDFDGFGIGGSFDKEDMYTAVGWVNDILPENKPRHLLGIGEPEDFFGGIENGADTFDCVAPTRMARNGTLYTAHGKINIKNAKYSSLLAPIDKTCGCSTCRDYTVAYISHLFRAEEMLAATLASIHNLYFIVHLVADIRQSILDDRFEEYRTDFLKKYLSA